jgi:hypothetical protein
MKILITPEIIRNSATGLLQDFERFDSAMPSDSGAGIILKIAVNVKKIGDGLCR